MTVNDRITRLREKALTTPQICVERGYLLTKSYRETEGEPVPLRRAKAFAKVIEEMTIRIEDGELIVGWMTSKPRGGSLTPEVRSDWYLDEADKISARKYDRFAPLSEKEKELMKEFLPYWKGRAVFDKWRGMLSPEAQDRLFKIASPNSCPVGNMYLTHNCPDFERVLNTGLSGIKKEVSAKLAQLDSTDVGYLDKYWFLKSMEISLDAVRNHAHRYAELARSIASKEKDPVRKAELQKIAEACDRVPENKPRSFYEAMQSFWFTFVAVMIEGWSGGLTFGRADQYLYPFYKKDIEAGKITPEEARELIALFFIKVQCWVNVFGSDMIEHHAGFMMLLSITLGGITRDGKDAVNDLSYLFLDVDERVKLNSPDIVIRVNKLNPPQFLERACEVLKTMKGKYKFVSDDTIIRQRLNIGNAPEDANDFIIAGCWASTIPGRAFDCPGAHLNLPLLLELALNDGKTRLTGEQIGPATGDPKKFKSYDDVWNAYQKQVEEQVRFLVHVRNADRQAFSDYAPCPFTSALFAGCIDKCLDLTAGGTAPNVTHALTASGAPNVGDSLAAIKKLVFEDKKISMGELIDALDNNFEGHDDLLRLLSSSPKFGNDDDYVDSIVNDIIVQFGNEVGRYKGIANGRSTAAAAIVTANVPMGYVVGALPDGRKAKEPLSEGGISPYQGRNTGGPTSTMRSIAKLDHMKLSNGSVLNMRFNPEALNSADKLSKFASLIRTYCETGGYLVQFNIISSEILKDARKHPEKYRDLLVRVATYSAYFVELGPEAQDDIIARMEFQEI